MKDGPDHTARLRWIIWTINDVYGLVFVYGIISLSHLSPDFKKTSRWDISHEILFERFKVAKPNFAVQPYTIPIITKTGLYNFDPFKPHFYVVNLGFTGVYNIFLISAQKHRLWVLVRTASQRRF